MARKEEDFSKFVSNTLHSIGYTWRTVQRRRNAMKQAEHIAKGGLLSNFGMLYISVGSKREGSTTPLGGDCDSMGVFKEVIATEDVRTFENKDNMTVLKLDTHGTSPGYARLSVVKHGGGLRRAMYGPDIAGMTLQIFIDSCCQASDSGEIQLSSEIFISIMSKMQKDGLSILQNYSEETPIVTFVIPQPRAGPSMPIVSEFCGFQGMYDIVYAMSCDCPSVLESFLNRPRPHGWPTEDTIRELSQLEAHVVPVGFKRSANHCLEWRICFTKAEIRLIECLEEPQFYVFVLLKIFAKDVLKNVWGAMTSYVMKNVILWVTELSPGHMFRTDTVVERFLGCLFFLKMCVKVGRLPSYMIEERNLLNHDQFVVYRPNLLSMLDDCLREKGSCLMRCSTLKDAMIRMYKSPASAMEYGLFRERCERAATAFWLSISHNPMMSMQDVMRIAFSSGQASGLLNIILEVVTEEDIDDVVRDPAATIQRIISRIMSPLM